MIESISDSGAYVIPDHLPVDNLSTLQDITCISQQFDWIRFGPLNPDLLWRTIERRFGYLDVRKTNHFGRWYVDLTGDQLEVVRSVEDMADVWRWLKPYHWTRLDVAFDLAGVDLDALDCPGSAIVNDGVRQTLYSHRLKQRGHFGVFARAYDAFEAGHDVEPGTVRGEVEFKLSQPDALRLHHKFPSIAFAIAAFELRRVFGLVIPNIGDDEVTPGKRLINHERERFYARFGRRIVADLVEFGFDHYVNWVLDCTRGRNHEHDE